MQGQENSRSDPLIDEVRERRRLVMSKHGNDLARLLETIRALQAEHPEKVISLRDARPGPLKGSRRGGRGI